MLQVGETHGELEVIGGDGHYVELVCSCGKKVNMLASKYMSGKYLSCGHLGESIWKNYPNTMRNDGEGEGA